MAKLFLARTYHRFPSIWGDPDPNTNRIFLNNYGHDFTTLAPRLVEMWYWQSRYNTWNQSSTTDFDNYAPVQLAPGMDGNAWAASNNDIWYTPGIFNLWLTSLDYQNYKATRSWKSSSGKIVCTYPRTTAASNVTGDWWIGYNMAERSVAWRHGSDFFHTHFHEQVENISWNADSWTYSGTTITVNKTAHGFWLGDEILVSGATATTNAPNGRFVVVSRANANQFTYTSYGTPTGTAGGTMAISGVARRSWGIETEADGTAPNVAHRTSLVQGYNYAYDDNNSAANTSTPDRTSLNIGTWKFWLGLDATSAWYVGVAGGTTNAYTITKYLLATGQGTETTVLSAIAPASPLSAVIMQFPSNLRHDSATKKVFYSGHYASTGGHDPVKFTWNPVNGTMTNETCYMSFPGSDSFATYAALPTANNWNGNGYNSYWVKPHQFLEGSTVVLTFCQQDGFHYSNTLRFPTLKSRTWLTYTATQAFDQNFDFHSGINFTANEFPLSWVPYGNDDEKIAVFSVSGVTIYNWDPLSLTTTNFTSSTDGSTTFITVTASNHGITVGDEVTISGTTADSSPPNGIYTVIEVPNANTFRYALSSDMNGVFTGTLGGTMSIKRGWRPGAKYSIRARGYSVDSLGRLWVTVRSTSIGRIELHLITDDIPNSISIVLQNAIDGTDTRYLYEGTTISTNVLVDAYDAANQRLAVTLDLKIDGDSMEFANGTKETQITTSSSASTSVAVNITGAGKSSITAEARI